jgi:hypothetical protein
VEEQSYEYYQEGEKSETLPLRFPSDGTDGEFGDFVSSSLSQTTVNNHTDFAYFSVMAGIDPFVSRPLSHSWSYLGYMLHFAAARYILDSAGSRMDFVVLVRLSKKVEHNRLPDSQANYFAKLGIRLEYLSPAPNDDWKSFIMEKFQILRYHHYRRILFLDADLLPLCNLDHYFDLAERGIFAPNMIFAFNSEPSNAGFFLVSPEPSDWQVYQQIGPFQNETFGFGKPLENPAEGLRENYTTWSWHCVKEDQGMLYHWVRNIKKNVTMVNLNRVQNWAQVDGRFQLVYQSTDFKPTCPNSIAPQVGHLRTVKPVYADIHHYTGNRKPWQLANWTRYQQLEGMNSCKSFLEVWGLAVREAWSKYRLGSVRKLIPGLTTGPDYDDLSLLDEFLCRGTTIQVDHPC